MARLSINEVTTFRWSFEKDVRRYAAAGYSALGVWRQKLSDFGEERGIDLIAECKLEVSNLVWAGGFTGVDGRSLEESIEDGIEAIKLAANLRAGCLVIYSGGRGLHTANHARSLLRHSLKRLLPVAADYGVTLALEPMHSGCAEDWTFLTCLDATLEEVRASGSERLKLAFDTYHLGHDPEILSRLAEIAPHVAVVHLGDGLCPPDREQDRRRLGEGSLPLREIMSGLAAGGYRGYYDVELIGEEIEACDYDDLLRQSRLAFADLIACPQPQ